MKRSIVKFLALMLLFPVLMWGGLGGIGGNTGNPGNNTLPDLSNIVIALDVGTNETVNLSDYVNGGTGTWSSLSYGLGGSVPSSFVHFVASHTVNITNPTTAGTYNFTWHVTNVIGTQITATFTVIVEQSTNPPNTPPRANAVRVSVVEGHTKNVNLSGFVDEQYNDAITQFRLNNNPSWVTPNSPATPNGRITLEPPVVGESSTSNFTYAAKDSDAWSTNTSIAINVVEGNPPSAYDRAIAVQAETTHTYGISVRNYNKDSDGISDPVTSCRIAGQIPDFVRFDEHDIIHVEPQAGDEGDYHFFMYASDMHGESRPATFTITVTAPAVQTPPDTSQNISRRVRVGNTAFVNLWDYVEGTNNDRINSFRLLNEPKGFITYKGGRRGRRGRVDIKPTKSEQVGTHNFSWCATDNDGESCGNFTVVVWEGTPPVVEDRTYHRTIEDNPWYDLLNSKTDGLTRIDHSVIQKTDGDPILEFESKGSSEIKVSFRWNDENDHTKGYKRIVTKLNKPLKKGTYTIDFRAKDRDGWSEWKTFTYIIKGIPPKIDVPDVNFIIGRSSPLDIRLSDYTTSSTPVSGYSWSGTLPPGMEWGGTLGSNIINNGTFESENDLNEWTKINGSGPGHIVRENYSTGWAGDAPNDAGSYFLYATGGNVEARQTIDISSYVSGGNVSYDFSAYLGGYGDKDTIRVKLDFKNSSDTVVASYDSGDFTSNKEMTLFSNSASLPNDTTKVTISLIFKRNAGGDTDGYVDNFVLKIKKQSNETNARFYGSPITEGDYTLGVTATNEDGTGKDNFTIHVIQPTPPTVHSDTIDVFPGDTITYKLFGNLVLPTDGDTISEYNITGTIPGVSFNTNTSEFTGSISDPGMYSVSFQARDRDGWSSWGKLNIHVIEAEADTDLCYDKEYMLDHYVGTCTPNFATYKGGEACTQNVRIKNNSTHTLTNVTLALDHTPRPVTYQECGVGESSSGCSAQKEFNFSTHHFNKGTEITLGDFTPNTAQTFHIKNSDAPVFRGENLYSKYKDENNEWHIARVHSCGGYLDHDAKIQDDFRLIYGGPGTAVLGDVVATGNVVVDVNDSAHYTGSMLDSDTHYRTVDPAFNTIEDERKRNSSSAKLQLPSYVKGRHIKWAGLFWQSYVHTPENEDIPDQTPISTILNDHVQGWNSVQLKTPDGAMYTITAANIGTTDANSSAYYYSMVDNDSYRFYYSAYANITDLVRNTYSEANNTFTVGNILASSGEDYEDSIYLSHANNDIGQWFTSLKMGYFGGWSLVVVYDLIGSEEMTDSSINITDVYRNVSLYNGYDFFATWADEDATLTKDIAISGFKTPSSGEVHSTMLYFGGGSDQKIKAEILQLQQKNNPSVFDNISNGRNPSDNQFNGTYSVKGVDIDPTHPYTQGMDMDIYDVSQSMDHNQSETVIKFGIKKYTDPQTDESYAETMFPQLLGLSTQLFTPKICYDFDVRIGDFVRVDTTEDREFTVSQINDDPLVFKILLKSEEADFDLIQSKIKVDFNTSVPLDFNWNKSWVSPPNINSYIPAIHAGGDYISVGSHNSADGGIIEPDKINYAKLGFDFIRDESMTARFDIDLNTSIQFSPSMAALPYILTSKGNADTFGHIDRCDRNRVYDPVLGTFNVERNDAPAHSGHATANPEVQYPLYTQITGRDYKVAIAGYTGEPNYNVEAAFDTTVELEVIDAGSFDNNASTGFDSVCQDPSTSLGTGKLFGFNGSSRISDIDVVHDLTDYNNNIAVENAAFRVWVLTKFDENGSNKVIVDHHITNKHAFAPLYNSTYKDGDDRETHYCTTKCGIDNIGTSCYDCLREYFAVPVCSRDNFAIRPESFRISVNDNAEDANRSAPFNVLATNNTSTKVPLAAGYRYFTDIHTTLYGDAGVAKGYYHHFRPGSANPQNDIAILEFATSGVACADTNDTLLDINMINGQINGSFDLLHNNVGEYDFWMLEKHWTRVDQADFPYKKHFGSCIRNHNGTNCSDCTDNSNSAHSGKVGCILSSDVDNIATSTIYKKLPIEFKPYVFDLDGVALKYDPSTIQGGEYLFMNDYDDPYYQNLILNQPSVGAFFEGNISALGKNGTVLSNFTDGCKATDVRLPLYRETAPLSENALDVDFQQRLDYGTLNPVFEGEANGPDANITLPKAAFKDDDNGTADNVKIYTTFKKPFKSDLDNLPVPKEGINPIMMIYKELNATGIESDGNISKVYAEMNYMDINGTHSYDSNITFVYGKVSPRQRFYDNVDTNWTETPIFADVYCDYPGTECYDKYDLNMTTHTRDESSSWYLATIFDNSELGTTGLSVSTYSGNNASPRVSADGGLPETAITDVAFNDDSAAQNDINISVTGDSRPSIVRVQYTPVPWLIYDPLNDYYRVKFIGPSDWAGVGKSGFVTDMNSSKETIQRMNW
jgi:methionine-rich copper-binding protein CopC